MSEDSKILEVNNNNYFFDAQSTTPIDSEVLSVINQILSNGHAIPTLLIEWANMPTKLFKTPFKKFNKI